MNGQVPHLARLARHDADRDPGRAGADRHRAGHRRRQLHRPRREGERPTRRRSRSARSARRSTSTSSRSAATRRSQEGLQALIAAPRGTDRTGTARTGRTSRAPEGPVGQRVPVHVARPARSLRHPLARRRRQGRRRGPQQGHHELVMRTHAAPSVRSMPPPATAGVTLIELLIVLSIMAIGAAFVVPIARRRRVERRAEERRARSRRGTALRA